MILITLDVTVPAKMVIPTVILFEFELATIVLDPNFVMKPEPRRLHVRKTLRGRPSKFKGKALARLD